MALGAEVPLLQGAARQGTQGVSDTMGCQDFGPFCAFFIGSGFVLCALGRESSWGFCCSWEPSSCPRTSQGVASGCCGLGPPEKTRVCLLARGKPLFAATPPGFLCEANN